MTRLLTRYFRQAVFGILATFMFGSGANAGSGVGPTIGAVVGGTISAIACDDLARSYIGETTESDGPQFLFWKYVDKEDLVGYTAGAACAVPGAILGGAVGTVIELAVAPTLAAAAVSKVGAAGTGMALAVGRGAHGAWQVARISVGKAGVLTRQWWGKHEFGQVAPSSTLRDKYMAALYKKQGGIDGICGNPLPNLYVGPPWNRRLNIDIEVDHIIPRANGGTDDLANLQLTHRKYNRSKGALVGKELLRAMGQFCPDR